MKKIKHVAPKQIFDPCYLKGGEIEKGAKKNGWHKNFKEKKAFMFTWEYCAQCDTMYVRCPMCGNNCCNAGFGKIKGLFESAHFGDDSKKVIDCPVCNLAYAYQHLAWKHKDHPDVSKKAKKEAKKKMDEGWSKIFG